MFPFCENLNMQASSEMNAPRERVATLFCGAFLFVNSKEIFPGYVFVHKMSLKDNSQYDKINKISQRKVIFHESYCNNGAEKSGNRSRCLV